MKLSTRLMAGSILTALLSLGVVLGTINLTVEQVLGASHDWEMPAEDMAACLASPSSWSSGILNVGRVYAYSPDGVSDNPAAPPIHRDLEDALASHTNARFWEGDTGFGLLHVSAAGPCAVVQTQFHRPPILDAASIGLLIGVVLAMLGVTGITQRFTVSPLLRRIQRVREAAEGVGSADYHSDIDDSGDALAAIAAVLDTSNERIHSDRDELLRRQQALEKHLAEVAHDLRTPLASLLLALQEVIAVSEEEQTGLPLRRALGDTAYVAALVDNLHEATRLRQGVDVTAGQSDLTSIVERLGARFVALGGHQGISVAVATPEVPLRVQCSPAFAERAIANLVHNAICHGQAGGNVAVLLEHTRTHFTLQVMDDGPGVPKNQLASLAQATFRDDAARQRSTGLGLAIANEVVSRAGWSVTYNAMEPSGLRVTIHGALCPG
ncbi:MAG: signal transduction histidine kinase [Myxococcota bacterium]|jgi:signal transduction histidine kinase